MKRILFIILGILCLWTSAIYAGDLTLTTYYPAPHGAYDRLLLVPRAGLSGACDIGTMYVDSATGKLQYCRNNGGSGSWDLLDVGVWEKSGNDIYATDTLSNPNLMIGIGTTTPGFELDVDGDINASETYMLDGKPVVSIESPNVADTNIMVGVQAGENNAGFDADWVTFLGYQAGQNNQGGRNVAIGAYAGKGTGYGGSNVSVGYMAGTVNTAGYDNVFVGQAAGLSNTTGYTNTFLGKSAGHMNTTGHENTYVGRGSGHENRTGLRNTGLGWRAGYKNNTGNDNVYLGHQAGRYHNGGATSVFVGHNAGLNNVTGSGNIFIGDNAGANETGSNKLYINNSSATPLIYGDFSSTRVGIGTTSPLRKFTVSGTPGVLSLFTGSDANGVLVDFNSSANKDSAIRFQGGSSWTVGMDSSLANAFVIGRFNNYPSATANVNKRMIITTTGEVGIGTTTPGANKLYVNGNTYINGTLSYNSLVKNSSAAFKKDIEPLALNNAIKALEELEPVTYYYKEDKEEDLQVGFIAEDVPDLVSIKSRKGIDPMDIIGVLTKVVQNQQKMLVEQQQQIDSLKSKLDKIK